MKEAVALKKEAIVDEVELEVYESPKLIEISSSTNLKSMECLAESHGSCSWK